MKTLFIILISLFSNQITLAETFVRPLWASEKCNATEQIPNSIVPGTLSRVIVMTDDESWDIVLLMKVKESAEIKSFPLGWADDATENNPKWENGSFTMKVDFEKGHYELFKIKEKVLTLSCEF